MVIFNSFLYVYQAGYGIGSTTTSVQCPSVGQRHIPQGEIRVLPEGVGRGIFSMVKKHCLDVDTWITYNTICIYTLHSFCFLLFPDFLFMYIYMYIYIKIGITQSYIESPDSQLHTLITVETDDDPPCHTCFGEKNRWTLFWSTLRQANMAMDNPLFIDYFPSFKRPPTTTSIYRVFPIQNSIYRNVPIKQHPFIEIVPLKPPCLRHFPTISQPCPSHCVPETTWKNFSVQLSASETR